LVTEAGMARRIVVPIAIVLISAIPAAAASITIGGSSINDQGQFSTVAGATTIDFNGLANGTQDLVTGIASYDNVNIFSCACSGTGDLLDDTTKGARALGGSSYAIDFSSPISYFGFYWGSPDADNLLMFFNGNTLLSTFSGADLNSMFGVGFGTSNAAYFNIAAGPNDSPATRVVFQGGQFPFETDNHAFQVAPSSVPEPTTLVLLATGGVGLLARGRWNRRAETKRTR
jgi:hypothetical protein